MMTPVHVMGRDTKERQMTRQNDKEHGSSAVECRPCNQVSPGSNAPLLPFRRLGIFTLSMTPQFTQLYK